MTDSIVVPDIAETIVGHRAWGLARTPSGLLLVSNNQTIWPARAPLSAACGKKHAPPASECTCGLYALTAEEGFPYYTYDGPSYAVWGEVHLWGEIIKGTKGYRAQHAYPKTLYLAHKDWKAVEPLTRAYGVPVHLANPYTKEAGDGHR